jgi:hypothetical protein
MLRSALLGAGGLAVVVLVTGCGSSTPELVAFENKTFYQYDSAGAGGDMTGFEQHYPPLDLSAKAPNPEYQGKTILGAGVHISRPTNWVIRAASNTPEKRYIEYVSPNEYIFSVYELVESPLDVWRDIMARYEDQAKQDGAEILGARVPMATWNAQGREYVVKRQVKAAKQPFVTLSREFLARGDHRLVLVQIVHQGDTLAPVSEELLRVVQTLEVL